MKELMTIAYEAHQITKIPLQYQTLFAEMFLAELTEVKGADIAPHLFCEYDVIHRQYEVKLLLPVEFFDKPDAVKGDVK